MKLTSDRCSFSFLMISLRTKKWLGSLNLGFSAMREMRVLVSLKSFTIISVASSVFGLFSKTNISLSEKTFFTVPSRKVIKNKLILALFLKYRKCWNKKSEVVFFFLCNLLQIVKNIKCNFFIDFEIICWAHC